jgi:hypothetical protein
MGWLIAIVNLRDFVSAAANLALRLCRQAKQ